MRDWVEYCNFAGDSTLARRRAANGSPHAVRRQATGASATRPGAAAATSARRTTPPSTAASRPTCATSPARRRSLSPAAPTATSPTGRAGSSPSCRPRPALELPRPRDRAPHYYCGTAGRGDRVRREPVVRAARQGGGRRAADPRPACRSWTSSTLITRSAWSIDEWGTWHFPTPGRNPAHLWQQSTLRDGLVAAITLDTFNRHADKLVMAQHRPARQRAAGARADRGRADAPDADLSTSSTSTSRTRAASPSARSHRVPAVISFVVASERRRMPGSLGSASIAQWSVDAERREPARHAPGRSDDRSRGASLREGELSVLTHDDLTAHNTFDEPGCSRRRPAGSTRSAVGPVTSSRRRR